jgi:hypothetical protein
VNEYRHLYPVTHGMDMHPCHVIKLISLLWFLCVCDTGEVRRDMTVPDLVILQRVLGNYWVDGYPPTEPFAYPTDMLEQRYLFAWLASACLTLCI